MRGALVAVLAALLLLASVITVLLERAKHAPAGDNRFILRGFRGLFRMAPKWSRLVWPSVLFIRGEIPVHAESIHGPGRYFVTAAVNPSATADFTLDPNAPLRPQEGSGPVHNVPGGIAFAEFVYLPLVCR